MSKNILLVTEGFKNSSSLEEFLNTSLTCQSEESVRQYGLGQHAVLDLVETDGLVVPPPVPAGDVEQVALHTPI